MSCSRTQHSDAGENQTNSLSGLNGDVIICDSPGCSQVKCQTHFITAGKFPVKTWICSVWVGLMLKVPVNSYGHVGTVSSPNHIFFLG